MPDCQQCGMSFARLFTLKRHEKNSHATEKRRLQCDLCKKDFSRKDLLKRHELAHQGKGFIACKHCGKEVRGDNVKTHESKCRLRHVRPKTTIKPSGTPSSASLQLEWITERPYGPRNTSINHNRPVRFAQAFGVPLAPLPSLNKTQIREILAVLEEDDTSSFLRIVSSYADSIAGFDEFYSRGNQKRGEYPLESESLALSAAMSGSLQILRLLHAGNVDIHKPDDEKRTTLHGAVFYARADIFEYLLDSGANITAVTDEGQTALHFLAYNETEDEITANHIIRLLIDGGVDIDHADDYGRTALCTAVNKFNEPLVRLLLKHGASVNGATGSYGMTPLQAVTEDIYCPDIKRLGMIELLLDHGADVNICRPATSDPDGYAITALCEACRNPECYEAVARLLRAGADVELGTLKPLQLAVRYAEPRAVKLLLEAGANPGCISTEDTDFRPRNRYISDKQWESSRMEKIRLVEEFSVKYHLTGKGQTTTAAAEWS